MKIKFIRLYMALDTEWEYEEKTDVWVFGDVKGYRYFQSKIHEAVNSTSNTHLEIIEKCGNSMQCVILPALDKPAKRPRIKFLERKIFKHDMPEMELIILGNSAGLEKLISEFDNIIEKGVDDLKDHYHFDDNDDKWIAKRSIALNVRGPLSAWDASNFQGYDSLILNKQESYMAVDWEKMTKELWEYKEPVSGEFPFRL